MTSRLQTLEVGAGEVHDYDIDLRNDLRILPGIDHVCPAAALWQHVRANSLSIITSNHVLEHMDETEQVLYLLSCKMMLTRGGMLLTWTPDTDWMETARASGAITEEWYQTLRTGKGDYPENTHRQMHNAESLRSLLEDSGFTVLSVREVGGSLEGIAFSDD